MKTMAKISLQSDVYIGRYCILEHFIFQLDRESLLENPNYDVLFSFLKFLFSKN